MGIHVAVPAGWILTHIFMAPIAKIGSRSMATEAGPGQPDAERLPGRGDVDPLAFSHEVIPPLVQQRHVVGPHELDGFDALMPHET